MRKLDGRTIIGKIVGAHGIKGTLKILPLTDHPDRFLSMDRISMESPAGKQASFSVASCSRYEGKGMYMLVLRGIDTRESAEVYRGWVITVPNTERVPLADGEYWIDSLIGMSVIDEDGYELGVLDDVIRTGSNDVYAVTQEGGAAIAIPAIEEVILDVDVDLRVMRVRVPEGLLDAQRP